MAGGGGSFDDWRDWPWEVAAAGTQAHPPTHTSHTLAKRILPSHSGYFSWTSLVAASHVGSSRWHQWHLRQQAHGGQGQGQRRTSHTAAHARWRVEEWCCSPVCVTRGDGSGSWTRQIGAFRDRHHHQAYVVHTGAGCAQWVPTSGVVTCQSIKWHLKFHVIACMPKPVGTLWCLWPGPGAWPQIPPPSPRALFCPPDPAPGQSRERGAQARAAAAHHGA